MANTNPEKALEENSALVLHDLIKRKKKNLAKTILPYMRGFKDVKETMKKLGIKQDDDED